jgi:phosphoadenosine phosphosulfate reductase
VSAEPVVLPYDSLDAIELIDQVLDENHGAACITCSFQIEGVIVLDLLRSRIPNIPVLFLDTGYHFAETYQYRDRLAARWKLNLMNVLPEQTVAEQEAEFGELYRTDPSACCHRRKVAPLMRALQPFDVWFTGLRREQSSTRRSLNSVERHQLPTGRELLKVNPLAAWSSEQVWQYALERDIEALPLYDLGFPSIGCEPCTARPAADADPRSGRWDGVKLECGIHTISTRAE